MSTTAPEVPSPLADPAQGRQREDVARGTAPRVRQLAVLAAVGAGLVALLGAALAVGGGTADGESSGLGRAGALVDWGAPVVTLVARIAAVGTVGALLFAAVLVPGHRGGLSARGRWAVRTASGWALAWAVATALGGLLALGRLVGMPPLSVPWSALRVYLGSTGPGRAVVVVAVGAAVLALAARRCSGVLGARVLLAGALTAVVVPAVLTGHSSAADDHLVAVTTLAVHVAAASLWTGGLGAVLWFGRRNAVLAVAAPRYSRLALGCFLATGVSGVVAAGLLLGGPGAVVAALGTGYGWLLVGKTLGMALLGLLGWQHRRRTLPLLQAGRPRAFTRFAVGEVLVMLATVALAVALAASPPPAGATPSASTAAPTSAPATAPAPAAAADPMAGHDHGELSVGVLVDATRFHVAGPVPAGSRVTVFNGTDQDVTLSADDGSFDVAAPAGSLITFVAPTEPGEHRFSSRHSASYTDVLVVE